MCVTRLADWSSQIATVGFYSVPISHDSPLGSAGMASHALQNCSREIRMWMEPDKPVVLVVQGELFVDDAADALERQGYVTYMWDTRSLPVDELAYVAKRLHPKFVMSINYQRGLAEGCRALGLSLVVWEIDPALDHLKECETPTDHCHIFTWRQKQVAAWRRARFEHVTHMPLAANHHRRTPGTLSPQDSRYRAAVSFVGSSLGDTVAYCRKVHPLLAEMVRAE